MWIKSIISWLYVREIILNHLSGPDLICGKVVIAELRPLCRRRNFSVVNFSWCLRDQACFSRVSCELPPSHKPILCKNSLNVYFLLVLSVWLNPEGWRFSIRGLAQRNKGGESGSNGSTGRGVDLIILPKAGIIWGEKKGTKKTGARGDQEFKSEGGKGEETGYPTNSLFFRLFFRTAQAHFAFFVHFFFPSQTVSSFIKDTFHKQSWYFRQDMGRQSLTVYNNFQTPFFNGLPKIRKPL